MAHAFLGAPTQQLPAPLVTSQTTAVQVDVPVMF
jgi:hypothetical protein